MCWAATAANMLSWWQHWDVNSSNSTSAPQGALNIYSQLKSDYGLDLADTGSVIGVDWWFNGGASAKTLSSQYVYNKNEKVFANGGGGFYSGLNVSVGWQGEDYFYASSGTLSYSYVNTNLLSVMQSHRSVGLGISQGENTGHSITMWGLEYDTDSNTISKLYVTDSDDYGSGLITLTCSTKEDDGKMFLTGDGYYSSGSWYVDDFFTLSLIQWNESAGKDPNAGFFSNIYVMDPLSLAGKTSGTAPNQEISSAGLGNVTFSGDVSYSTSEEVSLYAKANGEYVSIGDVVVKSGVNLSLTNASIEANGTVEADTANLSLESATFSGSKVTLTAGTVEMKNGVVESTNERGSATETTFKGTGTIKNMMITGGKLISGNSPGLTTLSGDQLATVELSFYLGAGENQEMVGAGKNSKIVLNTTLKSGVLEGTSAQVSSGFLLTQGTTLSGDITLSVWNDGESFSVYSGDAVYFSEGSYIQVIAFGEGVSYLDVLDVNFKLDSSISDSGNMTLMAVSDSAGGATWKKQVRTDGVYLVLSALPVYDVPEPATGVLVLTGLGLLLRRRRRGLARCARR